MRQLPTGISDYKEIIEKNCSYIDKTLLIEEVLVLGTKVILLPRPRRFGKTSNLSMLKYFFEKTDQDHSPLFQNFKIWKTEQSKEQGQYPVIFITLKKIINSTWEDAYKELKLLISAEFGRHRILLTALFPDPLPRDKQKGASLLEDEEKAQFKSILDGSANQALFSDSLKTLTLWLNRYTQKKMIVLIDEYDAPIHAAYLHSFYDPILLGIAFHGKRLIIKDKFI